MFLLFTYVYLYLPMFTIIYSCLFTYVYPCFVVLFNMFTKVHSCSPMLTHVY